MEAIDVRKLMLPDEVLTTGIEAMSDAQRQAIASWGLRMYGLGEAIVGYIESIKYGGRMIVLDDGTRWEVSDGDEFISELWLSGDRVAVIEGEMYVLNEVEKVGVEADE